MIYCISHIAMFKIHRLLFERPHNSPNGSVRLHLDALLHDCREAAWQLPGNFLPLETLHTTDQIPLLGGAHYHPWGAFLAAQTPPWAATKIETANFWKRSESTHTRKGRGKSPNTVTCAVYINHNYIYCKIINIFINIKETL